jgi:hypothetical protein
MRLLTKNSKDFVIVDSLNYARSKLFLNTRFILSIQVSVMNFSPLQRIIAQLSAFYSVTPKTT